MIVTSNSGTALTVTILGDEDAGDYLKFVAEKQSDGVRVSAKKKSGSGWGNSLDVKILINAPAEYNLRVTTMGGDVVLVKFNGVAKVMTSGGDIVIMNSLGDLAAATSGGDVRAEDVMGDLNAKSSGGDLDLSVTGGKLQASASGGDARVSYAGEVESIDVSTSAGDIELTLDRDAEASFHCETGAGEIEVERPAATIDVSKRDEASGEINGGGDVRLRNSAGDILLKSR